MSASNKTNYNKNEKYWKKKTCQLPHIFNIVYLQRMLIEHGLQKIVLLDLLTFSRVHFSFFIA